MEQKSLHNSVSPFPFIQNRPVPGVDWRIRRTWITPNICHFPAVHINSLTHPSGWKCPHSFSPSLKSHLFTFLHRIVHWIVESRVEPEVPREVVLMCDRLKPGLKCFCCRHTESSWLEQTLLHKVLPQATLCGFLLPGIHQATCCSSQLLWRRQVLCAQGNFRVSTACPLQVWHPLGQH